MPNTDINYLAVIAATIASMGIGALWYSSILFGKKWMKLIGKTKEELQAEGKIGLAYGGATLAWLFMSFVLAHMIDFTKATTFLDGAITALWIGAGFIATSQAIITFFEGRKWSLYFISVGYQMLALITMGVIHALWV